MYEDRWNHKEIGDFEENLKKLVKMKGNVMIKILKKKFSCKTVKELV